MGLTVAVLLERARATIERVEPAEAARRLAGGAVLLDLRPRAQRHADGEIPGAYVVSRNALEWRLCAESGWSDPRVDDRAVRPLLICAHGYQSSLAAAGLVELGFVGAGDVIGGFEAWRACGLPVVPHGDPRVLRVTPGGPGSALADADPYGADVR